MTIDPAYAAFLASKAPRPQAVGIEPREMPAHLFDFQAECAAFALRRGRAAMFLDTGLGKTRIQLEWARQAADASNGRALLLTPLAVARQIEREGLSLGYQVRVIREQSEAGEGINVCNYDRLDKMEPDAFGAVSLDECFAAGTLIDVVDAAGNDARARIETIRAGDHIKNVAGVDLVSDVHRREVPYAVRLHYAGQSVIVSPNHPFFTQRGWRAAQDIEPGDAIMATAAAVRMVRGDVHRGLRAERQGPVLRAILLSEMADAPAGTSSEGPQSGSGGEARGVEGGMVCGRKPCGGAGEGEDRGAQSHGQARDEGEGFPPIEGDRPQSFRAWGQRAWFDRAAEGFDGCSARQLDCGILFVTGPTDSRISDGLQDRLGRQRAESRYRGGWSLSSVAQGSGREEGCGSDFLGVDRLEVLELGHPELDRLRAPDGKLYFYDIGATRHPSFSVNGGLVHNSSILKNFTGATTRALIAAFEGHRFRLASTATPAPNDHMELGNHAEYLGAMRNAEMLSRWFINDTSTASQQWRLKGHAQESFWDWVASWARCAETPADLGYDASRFILPKLELVTHKAAGDIRAPAGQLFAGDLSATSLHDVKRQTAEARADAVAALVDAEPHEPWVIWCDTDYEADALAARVTGAIEVRGSHPIEKKEAALEAFATGQKLYLISKPSVCGMGLNWQHAARVAFVGRSFSYEAWYQAVRRCWRFGQARPVQVHIIVAEGEAQIGRVIDRKAGDHDKMRRAMAAAMRRSRAADAQTRIPYVPTHTARLPSWMCAA